MLSVFLYLLLVMALVCWVESQVNLVPKPLIIRRNNSAEDLEGWLKKFHWDNRYKISAQGQLPSYKFYTEIVELLLNLSRKMGGNYHDSLIFLREGLQADTQFEKKLKEALFGAWFQMGLIVILTWGFIFGALTLVDVKFSPSRILLIALWQGIGLSLLPLILSHYREKYFGDIGKLWKMFYILRSLVKVPLSRTEVLTIAGVANLKMIKQKSLLHIVDKLKETCQKTLQMGGSYEEDVIALMGELRFQEKWHFELFEKRLTVIKLGLMAIFFLPSYLVFIFLLLEDLLTLM